MSLSFAPLTPDCAPLLLAHFEKYGAHGRLCDYTACVLLMFRACYETEYAVQGDTLYLRMVEDGHLYYSVPSCPDLDSALDSLEEFCGKAPDFCTVPEELLPYFLARYPHAKAEDDRDWHDYLYRTEDLAALSGRSYHGQRNQIARFCRTYGEPQFLPLSRENVHLALAFLDTYAASKQEMSEDAKEEILSVRELLENKNFYGQTGGILVASDRVFGFVIGERVGDTVFDHVEKADSSAVGAYQMLVNLFARANADVPYMNREEDCGVEGLRKSKLSYRPIALLKKYAVLNTENDEVSQ